MPAMNSSAHELAKAITPVVLTVPTSTQAAQHTPMSACATHRLVDKHRDLRGGGFRHDFRCCRLQIVILWKHVGAMNRAPLVSGSDTVSCKS